MSEHQRERTIASDEFDLRNGALAVQRFHQRGQLRQLRAQFGQQRMAFAEFGDVARVARFAKTQHGAALLLHVAHRHAALAAVAPGRICERLEHAPGLHVADARQVLHQHALLGRDLRVLVHVLQHASGAGAEVRAARLDAQGRSLQYLDGFGFVEIAVAPGLARAHAFAGQGARDEYRLALDAAYAASVMRQVVDDQFEFARRPGRAVAATH
jgi:hypothetical protein